MAVLQQIRGTTPFQIHRLNQSVTSLGRHESCDVVIDVPQVSRSHAIITRDQDDQYFVEDLQSRNGTKVNDRKISERTRLYDGDRLEISSHAWQFLCEHGSTRTGNWAHVPQEIAVAVCSDPHDAQSVRSVQQNDFICSEELNAAPFDQSGIITELPLDNPAALMPAAAANVCLRSVLQLIHALTPELSTDELVSELSSAIFRAIPAAERVAVILEDDSGAGVRVAGAFVRGPVDHLEICLALIRHGLDAARATMTGASCLQGSESPPAELPNRRLLCCSLTCSRMKRLGVIQVDSGRSDLLLNDADLHLLTLLARVGAHAIEQRQVQSRQLIGSLSSRSAADGRRIRTELGPAECRMIQGFRLGHELIFSQRGHSCHVDQISLPGGRLACAMWTVDATGMEAAVQISLLGRLMTEALMIDESPAKAIAEVRRMLLLRNSRTKLPSDVVVACVSPPEQQVVCSAIGKCHFVTVSNGRMARSLIRNDPAFSDSGTLQLTDHRIDLNKGDLWAVISGTVERQVSADRQSLTENSLDEMLRDVAPKDPANFEGELHDRLLEFCDTPLQFGDIAIMSIHHTRLADTAEVFHTDDEASGGGKK